MPSTQNFPVAEYVQQTFIPLSNLRDNWEMHSAVPLSPAEERMMAREPVQAVPHRIAERLGKVRILLVPYLACHESGDRVTFEKPEGEKHSTVWLEREERIYLLLSCRDLDPHDTGFELLATIAELVRGRLTPEEIEKYTRLLEGELERGVPGEIDEEAREAKQPLLERRGGREASGAFGAYRDVSFTSTLAEYMHGLWHDVQIRVGPEHLPVPELRQRMILMSELYPPNAGYRVFSEELEKAE